MEFKIQTRDNYDKSLKIKNVQVLLYSKKALDNIAPNADIKGEVVLSNKNKNSEGDTIRLGGQTFAVAQPGTTNKLIYKTKGYVAVGDDEYIRIFQSRLPFLLLFLLLMLLATIAIVLIMTFTGKPAEKPVNPLPAIDPNLVIDTTPTEKTKAPEGGGSADISYRPNALLTLSTGKIEMGYTNPKSSSHDAVVQLYVVSKDSKGKENEYLIAKSGLIPQGNKLEVMTLSDDMKNLFAKEGTYSAKYTVSFYEPKTGEKAVVDSQMTDIVLKVQK